MSHIFEDVGPLVMLVEDDPTIGQRYRVGLENDGFRVALLSDESALFRAIDVDIPDVAVLDFQLQSVISATDIIVNLRLYERLADVPVFVLSNHRGDIDGQRERAVEAGATAWLVKGDTSPGHLAAHINEMLSSQAVAVDSAAVSKGIRPIKGSAGLRTSWRRPCCRS